MGSPCFLCKCHPLISMTRTQTSVPESGCMVPHYAAGPVSDVTARIGIVADVGHPACRQVLAKACICRGENRD